ncbi:MAG TPA: DUF721 domain-containing protein [Atribacteraceae bacterium]|nr:DUF721 domain-containing protein [Atribacteraceae bacterium]
MSFFQRKPGTLAEALQKYFQDAGLSQRMATFQILEQYPVFFPELATFSRPADYREGVLFLVVTDPLYTLEIQKRIPEVIQIYRFRGLPIERVKISCSD